MVNLCLQPEATAVCFGRRTQQFNSQRFFQLCSTYYNLCLQEEGATVSGLAKGHNSLIVTVYVDLEL